MQNFIDMAGYEALNGVLSNDGGPFGAVIVKDGVVIATGHNMVTSTNDPTAHAEIVAIRQACKKLGTFSLKGCTLYSSSEPCPMCFASIHWARLDRVVYANTKEEASKIGFDDMAITDIMCGKIEDNIPFVHQPSDVCKKSFRVWSEKEDKIPY